MDEFRQTERRGAAGAVRGDALLSGLISAGLFLYVGFALALQGVSDDAVYNASVSAFTWGARIIGFAILAGLALTALRVPGALLLELVISAAAAALCLVVGAIWVKSADAEGYLVLLFGVLNGRSAYLDWNAWREAARAAEPPTP